MGKLTCAKRLRKDILGDEGVGLACGVLPGGDRAGGAGHAQRGSVEAVQAEALFHVRAPARAIPTGLVCWFSFS